MLSRNHLLVALLLLVATVIATQPRMLYDFSGSSPVGPIDDGFPGWMASGCGVSIPGPGVVALSGTADCRKPWMMTSLPKAPDCAAVRLGARITTREVRPGTEAWQRPLAVIELLGDGGRVTSRDLVPVDGFLQRTSATRWSEITPLPSRGKAIRVRFVMAADAGEVVFENATVQPLVTRATFPALRISLITAWLVWLCAAAIAAVRSCRSRVFGIAAGVITVALIVGAEVPREPFLSAINRVVDCSSDSSKPIPDVRSQSNGYDGGFLGIGIQPWRVTKIGHVVVFLLLAMGLALGRPHGGLSTIIVVVLVLAAGTELLQGLDPSRSPKLMDFALDLGGAALGVGLAAVCPRVRRSWVSLDAKEE